MTGDRRRFLAATGAAALGSFHLGRNSFAQMPAAPSAFPGLIVRQQEPLNLEFPFNTLESFLLPTDRFYIRNHFPIPRIEPANWALEVGGAVERPFRISFNELLRMPQRTLPATMECAGNNRSSLVPAVRGVQWDSGAVGTAEWSGVPLAALLERAGVRNAGTEVVLEGADEGTVADGPGPLRYARSLPLAKARSPEVLLAHHMNGRDLTPAHGFPIRAVVPGWYGASAVKWLSRITVIDRPFQGFFQTLDYTYWERQDGQPSLRPIGEMDVKSLIARPADRDVIPRNTPYRVFGAAWTSDGSITRVDISTDGGMTWAAARLLGDAVAFAWRLWEFTWQNPTAGRHILMARATDSRNRVQPLERPFGRRNYLISHVLPVGVEVR